MSRSRPSAFVNFRCSGTDEQMIQLYPHAKSVIQSERRHSSENAILSTVTLWKRADYNPTAELLR